MRRIERWVRTLRGLLVGILFLPVCLMGSYTGRNSLFSLLDSVASVSNSYIAPIGQPWLLAFQEVAVRFWHYGSVLLVLCPGLLRSWSTVRLFRCENIFSWVATAVGSRFSPCHHQEMNAMTMTLNEGRPEDGFLNF